MATVSDILNFARTQVQSDSNGLTDANGIIFCNEALTDFHRRLVDGGVDAASIQEAYCDGKVPTNDGDGSTFLFPTDMIFLKAIEINYQDTQAGNYVRADQIDVSNIAGQNSFSYLRKNASQLQPKFDDHGDWYEIFPAFKSGDNISQAIRIMYFKKPTEFTSTADTVSYPESLDYRILGWRVASDYYYSLSKIAEGDAVNARYEERVRQLVATLSRGSQQPLQATTITSTGWEF